MVTKGKIKGAFYEAAVENGKRIHRVIYKGEVIDECWIKDLAMAPDRLRRKGLSAIAEDLTESSPCIYRKTCRVCGKEFLSISPKILTCSEECKVKNRKETRSKYYDPSKKQAVTIARERRIERERDPNLADLKEARRLGLSYGKYQAMLFIRSGGAAVTV